MKLTHGELRGLMALAVLLALVLGGIWVSERRIAPPADPDSIEAVRRVLEMSDSAGVGAEPDSVKSIERKKSGKADKRKQREAKPAAAPRKSPLDEVNA